MHTAAGLPLNFSFVKESTKYVIIIVLLRSPKLAHGEQGFMLGYFPQPITDFKFIIKCSLFLQKFKDAGQAETEDWLCLTRPMSSQPYSKPNCTLAWSNSMD
jgi:hypothetical protein